MLGQSSKVVSGIERLPSANLRSEPEHRRDKKIWDEWTGFEKWWAVVLSL